MAKDEFTFENVLVLAMRTPGVKINRANFLKKELIRYCPESVVEEAIQSNPAKAGISKQVIDKVSKQVINFETTKVTGLSAAASIPGGAAAVAAAMADITSYFAFILRALQELAYLYGYEDFNLNEDDMDSETMNCVVLFMGVMFGVQGAAAALKKLSDILAKHIVKKLPEKTLTKGVIFPFVKEIAAKIGVRMTKQMFADSIASFVPFVGAAVSGGLTFVMFRPGCMRLRKHLMSYNLCDPDYYKGVIDVDDFVVEDIADDGE